MPEPDGPVISTARPSMATVLAWMVSAERRGPVVIAGSFAVRRRKPDGEAGARWRVVAVLHVNLPVMAFDDCLGDGKAEARMPAEILALGPD